MTNETTNPPADEQQAPPPPPPMVEPPPPPPPEPDPCRHCGHDRAEHDDDGACTAVDDLGIPCDCPGFEPEPPRNEQGEELRVEESHGGGRITSIERPAPPAPPARQLSRVAFLRRFTSDESIDIDLASVGETREAAAMRRYVSLVNAAEFVDLDDPDTAGGVRSLEAAGLIGVGRADEILS